MRVFASTIVFLLWCSTAATLPTQSIAAAQPQTAAGPCGAAATAHVRTTLYFGLTRPKGTVSEGEWRVFLREQVTPRFPDGLTVWEANGQWRRPDGRISRERSKVLLLIHDESAAVRQALAQVIASYKRAFEQESVLWESAAVCAAF